MKHLSDLAIFVILSVEMSKTGPIILVEDDEEDQLLIKESLDSINPENFMRIFKNGEEALAYLMQTKEQPFLIICDINMPKMDGLSFRSTINDHDYLRKKSIPFVFFSTTASEEAINIAYELTVQGFFVKPSTFKELTNTLLLLVKYWKECKHPNS